MTVSHHPTAIIDPSAEIDSNVVIGPYAYIGPNVVIGSGCRIGPYVTLLQDTTLGQDNRIHAFAAIGGDPQSQSYRGEKTQLLLGDRNVIHEYATIHRGTENKATVIGSDNYFMSYTHVAHDCHLGSHIRMINHASLAGHVRVEDGAYLSGFAVVHQFCTIGAYSLLTPFSKVNMDVLPCVIVETGSVPSSIRGINRVGLQRANFSDESIAFIKDAYKIIFRSGLLMEQVKEQLAVNAQKHQEYRWFLDSILQSTRGILR